MAVVMIQEVPGADAGLVHGMRQAGVVDALPSFPGFRGHWSGATSSGYRVIELWDSREAFQEWYDRHIAPNLPPGAETTQPEFFDLALELKPRP